MKTAIIGFGKMGKLYDSLMPTSYIVDIYPTDNRPYFTYLEEFIHYHPTVDLVIVATPINTHFNIVKILLEANYNVLCEKPLCTKFDEAKILEKLAEEHQCILCQSTLERYNPTIKFVKKNIKASEVYRVESYRFGLPPLSSNNPMYDLGIHDIDLSFYLFKQQVTWQVNAGYSSPRREIVMYLKNGKTLKLDLLNKYIISDNTLLNIGQYSIGNPILEMLADLEFQKTAMNDKWSDEIKYLTQENNGQVTIYNNQNYLFKDING